MMKMEFGFHNLSPCCGQDESSPTLLLPMLFFFQRCWGSGAVVQTPPWVGGAAMPGIPVDEHIIFKMVNKLFHGRECLMTSYFSFKISEWIDYEIMTHDWFVWNTVGEVEESCCLNHKVAAIAVGKPKLYSYVPISKRCELKLNWVHFWEVMQRWK